MNRHYLPVVVYTGGVNGASNREDRAELFAVPFFYTVPKTNRNNSIAEVVNTCFVALFHIELVGL